MGGETRLKILTNRICKRSFPKISCHFFKREWKTHGTGKKRERGEKGKERTGNWLVPVPCASKQQKEKEGEKLSSTSCKRGKGLFSDAVEMEKKERHCTPRQIARCKEKGEENRVVASREGKGAARCFTRCNKKTAATA